MKKVLYCLFACALFLLGVVNVYGENKVMLTVTTQGEGQVAADFEGEEIHFSKKHPTRKLTEKTPMGTKFVVGAKASEGYVFKKWILDGEDYSTEDQIIIAVIRNMDLVAVFEEGTETDTKVVKEPSSNSNLLFYVGLGVIVVLLIAIGMVLIKRKK